MKFRIKVIFYYETDADSKKGALEKLRNNELDHIRCRTIIKEG